jgi:hypothetical protein
MHQRIPVSAKFAAEGFGGSKFTPMRSISGPMGRIDLGQNGGNGPSPAPSPSPAPAPAPSSDVVVRSSPFLIPPVVPVAPTYPIAPEPVYVTEPTDYTNTIVLIGAAIGLVALGAALS